MQNRLNYIWVITLPEWQISKEGCAAPVACPFSFCDIMSRILGRCIMSWEASKYAIRKREEESMTPPTEAELDKLQSRIDMREAVEDVILHRNWAKTSDAAIMAKYVLTLLDEIEELETTIATQARNIAEYKREELKRS
jgi:hypothetical protein